MNKVPKKKKNKIHLRKKRLIKFKNKSPLITLITVVYNGERFIEEAIKSVINQTYKNFEYIIIDGGSTDNTIDKIIDHKDYIDKWISEKDKGIYHAMNKGINLSSGKFIGFLNSDDFLYKNTLMTLAQAYKKKRFDYTLGSVDIVNEVGKSLEKMRILKNFEQNNKFYLRMPTAHQGFYISRDLINKIGLFDINFHLSADFDMVIRAIKYSKNYFIFDHSVGGLRLGGKSSIKSFLENYVIMRKHNIHFLISIYATVISILKFTILKTFRHFFIFNKLLKIYQNFKTYK